MEDHEGFFEITTNFWGKEILDMNENRITHLLKNLWSQTTPKIGVSERDQQSDRELPLNQQLQQAQKELQRLQQEWAQKEELLNGEISQTRRELDTIQSRLVQSEQGAKEQLWSFQFQAEQEKADLARSHGEKVLALHQQHADREQVLSQQLQSAQQEIRRLEQDWVRHETALGNEIAGLQSQIQALQHAQERQAQQHSLELSSQQEEHKRQIQVWSALEAERKAEIANQHRISMQLRQSLAKAQDTLAMTHATWSWRVTAPLRSLATLITPDSHTAYALIESAEAVTETDSIKRPRLDRPFLILIGAVTIAAVFGAALFGGLNLVSSLKEQAPSSDLLVVFAVLVAIVFGMLWPASKKRLSETKPATLQVLHYKTAQELPPIVPPKLSESKHSYDQELIIELKAPSTEEMANPIPQIVASTLDDLLAYHDQAFIHCAYQTLLGRSPDQEGLRYYLGRLRAGFSKTELLAQLSLSKEGMAYAATLPDLNKAIRPYRMRRLPLIGWLFKLISGSEGNGSTERKLRSMENRLLLNRDESNGRLDRIETALTHLQHLVTQKIRFLNSELSEAHETNLDLMTLVPIKLSEPDGLNQLTARAKETYFQLMLQRAVAMHIRRGH